MSGSGDRPCAGGSALSWHGSVSRAFLARCATGAASLGYGLLLAAVLSPESMGEFAFAVSVAVIGATVSKCGLDAYVLRRAAERPHASRRLALRCLSAAGLAGLLVSLACVAVGFDIRPGVAVSFGVMQLAVPFLAMSFVLAGLLKAADLPAAAVFLETGGWQTAMCACAILMLYAGSHSPLAVAVCFVAGSALTLAGFLAAALRLVAGSEPPTPVSGVPASGVPFREVAPLAAVSACHVLTRWSDVLWLSAWLDARTVAAYTICTRLAGGIAFIDHAVNAVAAPRFARSHAHRETGDLRKELRRACAASGACGLLGAVAMALLAPFILARLGPPYADAAWVLQVAAGLMVLQVTLAPIGHVAAMSGRAADHLKALGVALALQQVAYLLLIPRFGMVAALVGFALPRVLAHLLTLEMLRCRGEFGARGRAA